MKSDQFNNPFPTSFIQQVGDIEIKTLIKGFVLVNAALILWGFVFVDNPVQNQSAVALAQCFLHLSPANCHCYKAIVTDVKCQK